MPVQPDQLQPRALCSLLDVCQRAPGYTAGDDPEIDETLNDLIVQESRDFVEATGREVVAMATGPRTFDLTASNLTRRKIRVGDAATVSAVQLFDYDGTTSLGVIAANLYVLEPRIRDDWQPIRRIWFPYRPGNSILLAPGRTLVVTGTWGFPAIPDTVKRAVATLVIARYLTDTAEAGTAFSDAVNRAGFNFAGSIRAALDVRDRLSTPPFA